MSAFNITAADAARRNRVQGYVGDLSVIDALAAYDLIVNDAPAVAQAGTVVVATATDSYEYIVTVNSVAVSFTSGVGTTKALVAAGIAAAINAEPLVRGQVSAVTNGTDTVTVTSLYPGTSFTMTETEAKLTTVEAATASADAAALEFGRLVVSTEFIADTANRKGGVARSTMFTAQADTYTVTYDAAVLINVEVIVEGETYRASHLMATDLATSLTAVAALLNTALPANSVIATVTATTLVLTSELAGRPFTSAMSFGTGADTGAFTKVSTAGIATDVTLAAVGIAKRDLTQPATTVGSGATNYPARSLVTCVRSAPQGGVWVASAETIALGDKVYVELDGSGSVGGRFYKAPSATRALFPKARWIRDERSSPGTDGISLLSISL